MKLKAVNKNREFVRAYKKGQCYVGNLVVLYVLKNRYGFTRFGITSSKKIGNAVKRNRARRLIRTSVRNLNFDTSKPMDIIIVPRAKSVCEKQQKIQSQLENLAKQAGLL